MAIAKVNKSTREVVLVCSCDDPIDFDPLDYELVETDLSFNKYRKYFCDASTHAFTSEEREVTEGEEIYWPNEYG